MIFDLPLRVLKIFRTVDPDMSEIRQLRETAEKILDDIVKTKLRMANGDLRGSNLYELTNFWNKK